MWSHGGQGVGRGLSIPLAAESFANRCGKAYRTFAISGFTHGFVQRARQFCDPASCPTNCPSKLPRVSANSRPLHLHLSGSSSPVSSGLPLSRWDRPMDCEPLGTVTALHETCAISVLEGECSS